LEISLSDKKKGTLAVDMAEDLISILNDDACIDGGVGLKI
jgi:hypothetical protein